MKTLLLLTFCALLIVAGIGPVRRWIKAPAPKYNTLPTQIPNVQTFFPFHRIK